MQETWDWSLGWEDPLEKEMATHSSILAGRISYTEEPGGLQSMGSQSRTWQSESPFHFEEFVQRLGVKAEELKEWAVSSKLTPLPDLQQERQTLYEFSLISWQVLVSRGPWRDITRGRGFPPWIQAVPQAVSCCGCSPSSIPAPAAQGTFPREPAAGWRDAMVLARGRLAAGTWLKARHLPQHTHTWAVSLAGQRTLSGRFERARSQQVPLRTLQHLLCWLLRLPCECSVLKTRWGCRGQGEPLEHFFSAQGGGCTFHWLPCIL